MYTADNIIQEAAMALSKFGKFIKLTDEDTKGLITMTSTVKQILNNASNEIYRVANDFKKGLKENPFEHPLLVQYMFELTTLFQKVSKFQMDFSLILNNNFIEPLTQFHGDSSRHNLKLFKELEALVTNLEKNKKAVKHSREAYYQLSSNAEKSEERLKAIIDKLDKGTVSKKELTRETEKSAELKVIAQEAKMAYEEKCQVSNRGWQEFREKFFVHFETFDLKEENRIDIVKRKVLALGNDLRSFHKTENPIPDIKSKFKEIESQPGAKRLKSIVELIFGGSSVERFKLERREDIISYERYKIEKEQRMFEESFYIVDMEDATEEETDDLRMIITIIFNHFNEITDSKNVRRRGSEHDDKSYLKQASLNTKLFDDNQIVNVNRVHKLFNKASLRDSFIKECVKRIPEKTQMISISHESFTNMSIVLKSIISHMENVRDFDPAKVLAIIRIVNTFYTKIEDHKEYLLQPFQSSAMFRDILM